ncbi:MAG TPA: DUF1844 domain-containing protein [Candidatus Omnitrophota bacterium]|nr:DUF1844 domain-containing protein [Candidatus Omnitrophota bacterium]
MKEQKPQFTKKQVDESWKESVLKEKGETPSKSQETPPISFSTFVTSLGIQALIKMGEFEDPNSAKMEIDLDGAQETIDLLLMFKEKTKGNLTSEEETLLNSLIPDLQFKFVQRKMA